MSIDDFHGIDQSRGTHHSDYGTSPDAINFISRHGKLYTAGGAAPYGAPAGVEDDCQGRLHQAYFRCNGEDNTRLILFVNGCIYSSDSSAEEWTLIGSGFHSDNWDLVNYRDGVTDWVIMTNGIDPVQYWDGMSKSVSMLANIESDADEVIVEDGDESEEVTVSPTIDNAFIPDVVISAGETVELCLYNFSMIEEGSNIFSGGITVESSDNSIASVSPSNVGLSSEVIVVTGNLAGNVTITATQSYGRGDLIATINVSVKEHCTGIVLYHPNRPDTEITSDYLNVKAGSSMKMPFKMLPVREENEDGVITSNGCTDTLIWESSDESIATVKQDGTIIVRSLGEGCVITVSAVDGDAVYCERSLSLFVYNPTIGADGVVRESIEIESLCVPYQIYSPNSDMSGATISETSLGDVGYVKQDDGYYWLFTALDNGSRSRLRNKIPAGAAVLYAELSFWFFSTGLFASALRLVRNDTEENISVGNYEKILSSGIELSPSDTGTSFYELDITEWVNGENNLYVFIPPYTSISNRYMLDSRSLSGARMCLDIVYKVDGSVVDPEENLPTIPEPEPIQQGGDVLVFSQIALLKERLWGAVSPLYPDRIYWSNAFDPNDWELDWEDSSNVGGGFIDIATFDGTRIRAIISAFDEVLVFKDKSIHRITGSSPGEFSVASVYSSEGTLAPRSIVYTGDKVYFLTVDGLCVYNGVTAAPMSALGDRKLRDIWKRINESTISTACAVLKDNIIYLAVPLDGSVINTHVIEYNLYDGTYSIIALPGVDDWLLMREGQKETLLYLDGDQVCQYDRGYTFRQNSIDAYWISPEISGGSLSSRKTTGRVYMRVEAHSIDYGESPQIKITMISGNKIREKVIKLKDGVNDIRKRVKVRGRTFRFKIENIDGNPLTIHKGVEIVLEEDYD